MAATKVLPSAEVNTPLQDLDSLTEREFQVLGLIANGDSNATIAEKLGIKLQTVRHQVYGIYGIYSKLPFYRGVNKRVKAALMYRDQLTADLRQAGLIDGEQSAFEFFKERLVIEPLTPREYGVLSLLARGYSNARIAGKLNIGEGSTRIYINSIYSKLGIDAKDGVHYPKVLAMLMFDRIPAPKGYTPRTSK